MGVAVAGADFLSGQLQNLLFQFPVKEIIPGHPVAGIALLEGRIPLARQNLISVFVYKAPFSVPFHRIIQFAVF